MPHREPAAEDLELGGRSLDVVGGDGLLIFSVSLRTEALQQLLREQQQRNGRRADNGYFTAELHLQ